MRQLKLGQKARDVVTKFEGVLTGRATYLTGCDQYIVTPEVNDKGEAQDARWFDVNRLEIIDPAPVKLPEGATSNRENGPGPEAPSSQRRVRRDGPSAR